MTSIRGMGCCGVKEICDLHESDNPKEALLSVLSGYDKDRNWYDVFAGSCKWHLRTKKPTRAFTFIFTQANGIGRTWKSRHPTYGKDFATFIRDNELGEVIESFPQPNPNYRRGHQVITWVWNPDPAKLWKWWLENKPADAKERRFNEW